MILAALAALALYDTPGLQKQAPPSTPKGYPQPNQQQQQQQKEPQKELLINPVSKPSTCTRKTKNGDTVSMHYKGSLDNASGRQFDSSYDRNEPITFQLGKGQVIPGWDIGLVDMCEGEKRELVIPPHLGYGAKGAGGVIPGGATLFFCC